MKHENIVNLLKSKSLEDKIIGMILLKELNIDYPQFKNLIKKAQEGQPWDILPGLLRFNGEYKIFKARNKWILVSKYGLEWVMDIKYYRKDCIYEY